jgi:uncharacterized protein (UPF0276 family)
VKINTLTEAEVDAVEVDAEEVDAEVAVAKPAEIAEIPRIGLGFRPAFAKWILSRPKEVHCVEITAEHFFNRGHDTLTHLSECCPIYVHGLGLSLGTPGPLDRQTLTQFQHVVEIAKPDWISEHMAFTRSADVDLGHLNPVPWTRENLQTLVDHSREVMDVCGRPLLLENVTTFLSLPGEMPETEFINQLCDRAGVGLLLDVTNLLINSRNHHFDPLDWLHNLEPDNITQLHIVGYSIEHGVLHDRHSTAIQQELFDLLAEVVSFAPVQSVVIERDANFPPVVEMAAELKRVESACESARLPECPDATSE